MVQVSSRLVVVVPERTVLPVVTKSSFRFLRVMYILVVLVVLLLFLSPPPPPPINHHCWTPMIVVVTAVTTAISIPSTIIRRQQQQRQRQRSVRNLPVSPSSNLFWSSSSHRLLRKLQSQIHRGGSSSVECSDSVTTNTDDCKDENMKTSTLPERLVEPQQLLHRHVQLLQQKIDSYKQSGIDLYKQQQSYLPAAMQFQTAIQLLLEYPIHNKKSTTGSNTTTCLQDILGIASTTTTKTTTTTSIINALINTTTATTVIDLLEPSISSSSSSSTTTTTTTIPLTTSQLLQEYATLILHETLCYIQYMEGIMIPIPQPPTPPSLLYPPDNCHPHTSTHQHPDSPPQEPERQLQYMDHVIHETTTLLDVLQKYITTTPTTVNDNDNDDNIDNDSSDTDTIPIYIPVSIVTAIRARAHYRRSKAMYYKIQLLQQQQQQQQSIPPPPSNATIESSSIMSATIGTDTESDSSDQHDKINSNSSTIATAESLTSTNDDTDTKINITETMDVLEVDPVEDNSNQDSMIEQLETNMYNDVRIAAYLGDKKAVQWYGQRMRHRHGSSNSNNHDHPSSEMDGGHLRPHPHKHSTNEQESTTSSSMATTTSSASDTTASTNFLSSLLMGGNTNEKSSGSSTSTTNLISQMLMSSVSSSLPGDSNGGGNSGGFNPIQSIARSMLQRVTNDVQFQSTICQFLQNVSMQQIQQYLQLFGLSNVVTLPAKYIEPVIQLCHAITLIRLQRMIFITKCINYCRQIVQRILRIIHKYHSIIVLYFVSIWIQSSIKRPIPISKKMRRRLQQQPLPAPPLIH